MATLRDKFDAYFETLNSTSGRMMADMAACRQRDGWNEMTEDEKTRILWKCLVTDAEEKYGTAAVGTAPAAETGKCFPVLDIKSGEKIVIDEDTSNGRPFGCSWRDEHSSPFLWQTKSQLNLHLLDGPKVPPKVPPRISSRPDRTKPPVSPSNAPQVAAVVVAPSVPPPAPPTALPIASFLHSTLPPVASTLPPLPIKEQHKPVKTIQKPKAPPPCPPVRSSSAKPSPKPAAGPTNTSEPPAQRKVPRPDKPPAPPRHASVPVEPKREENATEFGSQSSIDSLTKSIPKTGFDFLDNW